MLTVIHAERVSEAVTALRIMQDDLPLSSAPAAGYPVLVGERLADDFDLPPALHDVCRA